MYIDTLLEKARYYHDHGIPLPLDLYTALLGEGVDASAYDYAGGDPEPAPEQLEFGFHEVEFASEGSTLLIRTTHIEVAIGH